MCVPMYLESEDFISNISPQAVQVIWLSYMHCSHIYKLISNNIKEHRWILSSTLTIWNHINYLYTCCIWCGAGHITIKQHKLCYIFFLSQSSIYPLLSITLGQKDHMMCLMILKSITGWLEWSYVYIWSLWFHGVGVDNDMCCSGYL